MEVCTLGELSSSLWPTLNVSVFDVKMNGVQIHMYFLLLQYIYIHVDACHSVCLHGLTAPCGYIVY